MSPDPHFPIIALWATPRTLSTAFERMMIERGDHEVFDEPFSASYYFSSQRRSDRFDRLLPDSEPEDVLGRLETAAESRPVFFKDMAYQAGALLGTALLDRFVNTFIIREPTAALASFAARWPDLTDEEGGCDHLWDAYQIAGELRGGVPPVIDSDDLRADPPSIVRAWCEAVDIDFLPDALSWEPGMAPQWTLWPEWYGTVAASEGFLGPSDDAPVLTDPRLRDLRDRCLPIYESLHEVRLRG